MNRKIMSGLSYGFYFIIICIVFLIIYLLFFKEDSPKKNINQNNNDNNSEQIVSENIKLNKNNVSLDIGGSFDLKVTLIPSSGSEMINYESMDTSIATVSDTGKIVGVSEGTTTILVGVEGTELKAECTISVSSNVIVIRELFVNEEKVQLVVGDNYKINVSIVPNNAVDKTLIFTSSNESIASVDEEGVVTGLKSGRTKIFVQSKSNPEVKIELNFFVE